MLAQSCYLLFSPMLKSPVCPSRLVSRDGDLHGIAPQENSDASRACRRERHPRAALVLRTGGRQVRRLYRRFRLHGDRGESSGDRWRPGPNRLSDELREKGLDLIGTHYPDFGSTFATKKLQRILRAGDDPASENSCRSTDHRTHGCRLHRSRCCYHHPASRLTAAVPTPPRCPAQRPRREPQRP